MSNFMGTEGKVGDIPNSGISHLLGKKKPSAIKSNDGELKEFNNILKDEIGKRNSEQGIHLSLHAARRIRDRQLEVDNEEYVKLREGIDRLRDKGGRESLIVTDRAAYIVDVDKNKIVTAIDKNNLGENVFTKIDSTLFIN